MIRFSEAQRLVGPKPEIIPTKIEYLAYKGMQIEKFDTFFAAKEFSTLVDAFASNEEEVEASKQAVLDWEYEVFQYWYSCLQQEFAYLPEGVFELCYDQAYDRGHSAGYDEVASYMRDIVDFAQKVIAAAKTA